MPFRHLLLVYIYRSHQTDTRDQQYVQLVRLLAIYKQECELIDCLHAACGPDCDAVAMAMRPRRSTDTSTSRTIAAVVMDIYDAEGSLV